MVGVMKIRSQASAEQAALRSTSDPRAFDQAVWMRLPQPGARCPVSGLSRTSLVELIRPCERNNFRPPVEGRYLKRRGAKRGIALVSRESLLAFLETLPRPSGELVHGEVAR